jgi:transcriptional regulator with GAF, ATPase, and Fis domain
MRSPFSGWLVPVARSGHTTKKIKSSFLAPDDADAAEGFAGQAWSMNQTVFQDGLKSINASSCEDDVLDYANRTWVGTWWVDLKRKEKKPMCKALCGIPISVSGELWGVLVVDSTKPKAILDPNSVTTQVMQLEFILGKVIKGA